MKKIKKIAALIMSLVVCSVMNAEASTIGRALEPYPDDFYPDGCERWLGDVNLDYQFTVSDVIMLQKYLLGTGTLTCWENADFNYDGEIDIFDLSLMKQALVQSMTVYSSAVYSSADEAYTMEFRIATDYRKQSRISVTWIDPDGDREKTDTFSTEHGNPFVSDGQWEDDVTFTDQENYWLRWGDTSVKICWNDSENGIQETELEYPDRTRTLQSFTKEIINPAAPEVSSVDISAETYGSIERKASVGISGNVFVNDTVGRVGSAIRVNVADSIESYTVTLHYNEDDLRWVPKENLIILAYDESAPIQVFIELTDAVHDMENHTITFEADRDCYFVLADVYQWYKAFGKNRTDCAYSVTDITQYPSDWERNGKTGDIMTLADKAWVKNEVEDGTITVSNAAELASAVYYLNAITDVQKLLPSNSAKLLNPTIELTDDIDLTGYEWVPISIFDGELNGNGHTVSGMTVSASASAGFIASAGGSVHDIDFVDASVTLQASSGAAGIVAARYDLPSKPRFENVHVSGNMKVSENAAYGGILGQGSGSFTNCSADVLVNGTTPCTYLSSQERTTQSQLDNGEELITLTLDMDARTVTRTSDESIDRYTLVIIRDDKQILAKGFDNSDTLDMTEIPDYTLAPGSYQMYVTAFKGSGYQRISNVISYEITE